MVLPEKSVSEKNYHKKDFQIFCMSPKFTDAKYQMKSIHKGTVGKDKIPPELCALGALNFERSSINTKVIFIFFSKTPTGFSFIQARLM